MLIIGGDSIIGAALSLYLTQKGCNVTTTSRRPHNIGNTYLFLDLSDRRTFTNLLHEQFDVAIICAGITSVQECETKKHSTREVNVSSVTEIGEILARKQLHLIYLSTNMVFSGDIAKNKSNDEPSPSTEYGRQKMEVEKNLSKISNYLSIIRLSKVIQKNHPLFLNWYVDLVRQIAIYPYSNVRISPISLNFVNSIITSLICLRSYGIVHVSASSEISYAEAAAYLAVRCGLQKSLIRPHDVDPKSMRTLKYATLDTETLRAIGFNSPSPASALDDVVKHINQQRPTELLRAYF